MSVFLEVKGKELDDLPAYTVFQGFPYNFYDLKQSKLSDLELRLKEYLKKVLLGQRIADNKNSLTEGFSSNFFIELKEELNKVEVSPELVNGFPSKDLTEILQEIFVRVIKKNFSNLKPEKLVLSAVDEVLGYSFISPFMRDQDLEEIMVNGLNKNIFVFHRKFGMCKTNFIVKDERLLERLLHKVAFHSGRKFDESHPLLDAKLPDGSRANAT
ncbi:MAG: hypothetical protein ABH821_01070, partial [archaeon]